MAARGADDLFLSWHTKHEFQRSLARCISSVGEIYGDWRGRDAVFVLTTSYSVSKFVYITYLLLYISPKGPTF